MPKLLFRGASVRYFDTRQSQGGEAVFVRIHMSADFTDVVRAAMEWDPLPDSFTEGKLSGQIAATSIAMKGSKGLGLAFELAAKAVGDFKVVTVKGETSTHRELRFVVVTDEKGAYTTVGDFVNSAGKAACQLTVIYTEQASLIDSDVMATEEQQQGVLMET